MTITEKLKLIKTLADEIEKESVPLKRSAEIRSRCDSIRNSTLYISFDVPIDDEKSVDGTILTFSGKLFSPLCSKIEDIYIEDIAHSLSNQCRFSGHTKYFYSVAQHSVLVSRLCGKENRLKGLLHDASEAYLVDIPTPLKKSPAFYGYRESEKILQSMIFEKFGLTPDMTEEVIKYDQLVACSEARVLMPESVYWSEGPDAGVDISPWKPKIAKAVFLHEYRGLTGGTNG